MHRRKLADDRIWFTINVWTICIHSAVYQCYLNRFCGSMEKVKEHEEETIAITLTWVYHHTVFPKGWKPKPKHARKHLDSVSNLYLLQFILQYIYPLFVIIIAFSWIQFDIRQNFLIKKKKNKNKIITSNYQPLIY